MNNKNGFTMMEIVIVVIMIGLLAVLTMPRLTQGQEAARLSEGVQILKTFRGAQDRYFLDHAAYANDCNLLDVTIAPENFNVPTCAAGGNVSIQRNTGAYTITVTPANAYSCAPAGTCGAGTYLGRYLP